MGPRVGLDVVEKRIIPYRNRTPDFTDSATPDHCTGDIHDVNWIELAQSGIQWRGLVVLVLKHRISLPWILSVVSEQLNLDSFSSFHHTMKIKKLFEINCELKPIYFKHLLSS